MDYETSMKELKKVLKDQKWIIGADKALKGLKSGKIDKLFIAKNCKPTIKEDLERYSKFANVPFYELDVPNTELGIMCKRQYSVSVLYTLKGE